MNSIVAQQSTKPNAPLLLKIVAAILLISGCVGIASALFLLGAMVLKPNPAAPSKLVIALVTQAVVGVTWGVIALYCRRAILKLQKKALPAIVVLIVLDFVLVGSARFLGVDPQFQFSWGLVLFPVILLIPLLAYKNRLVN